MKTWTTTLTAAEAIAVGACDGRCLAASKSACDCVCGGAYHGVLAGSAIGEVTHTVRAANTSAPRTVRRHHTVTGVAAATRMLDMRSAGRTYREIADDLGVSPSTVRKRIDEFVTAGSIPLVAA